MGKDLVIIGKSSVSFRNKEIENKSRIIDLLNSLKLENSEFLKEMCIKWNSPNSYYSQHMKGKQYEEYKKQKEQELERCLKVLSWQFSEYEDDEYCYDSKQYYLEGPYGLNLEINKYFFEVSIWIGRYFHWFNTNDDYNVLWREKWRLIIYKITNILGGEYVMYFPDNASDISIYLPCDYCFPKEMEEHLKADIKDLDQVVELISERYSQPINLAEADKLFEIRDKDPFVIDRFEDLDKTLKK
jgi:hypothetical protein